MALISIKDKYSKSCLCWWFAAQIAFAVALSCLYILKYKKRIPVSQLDRQIQIQI